MTNPRDVKWLPLVSLNLSFCFRDFPIGLLNLEPHVQGIM